MGIPESEWSELREDVGYIKAKIESIPDHEERIRDLEKKWWQFPGAAVLAVIATVLPYIPHS